MIKKYYNTAMTLLLTKIDVEIKPPSHHLQGKEVSLVAIGKHQQSIWFAGSESQPNVVYSRLYVL